MKKTIILFFALCLFGSSFAGNPDRQGEAGAYELLMNPWAQSAGLHSINSAGILGVEAMRLNPAGIARVGSTQLNISQGLYLTSTGIKMNALGFVIPLKRTKGEGSEKYSGATFGMSIMSLNFGDIVVRTVNSPEGTGSTYSPSFVNIGVSYGYTFEEKVFVAATVRVIREGTADVSATGVALDAGVQYISGERDNFKFGISLRNVGTSMSFGGEGLAEQLTNLEDDSYTLSQSKNGAEFELPTAFNIGVSYDFYIQGNNRLTTIGNFNANSFSRDEVGAGFEIGLLNEKFVLRGAYKYRLQKDDKVILDQLYTGLAAGATFNLKPKKDSGFVLGLNYAFRTTSALGNTHNFGIHMDF